MNEVKIDAIMNGNGIEVSTEDIVYKARYDLNFQGFNFVIDEGKKGECPLSTGFEDANDFMAKIQEIARFEKWSIVA